MKKYITLLIVLSILPIAAQVDFGMRLRLRSEMQTLNSTNSDHQIYDRAADIRMRPHIDYTVNDYISLRAVLEIGDIRYGSNGGTIGTDGVNLQTKNLFMSLQPTSNHIIKLGLLPYKDAHSMILDTDIAGIMWNGKFDNYKASVGWFAARDDGEKYINENSYSFGETVLLADFNYKHSDNLEFGINNIFVLNRQDYRYVARKEFVSIYFAPRADLSFGDFSVNAQFVMNNNYIVYNPYVPHNGFSEPASDISSNRTGLAFSMKSSFQMDDKTTFRANLLFRGCYKGWENYESYKSDYDTGLEIINENPYGISGHNPMRDFMFKSIEYQFGLIVPALFVDWKYTDIITFTGGFGLLLNDTGYGKKYDFTDFSETINEDVFMGWEMNLKSQIVLFENLQLNPFMALFVPTDNFVYNRWYQADDENGNLIWTNAQNLKDDGNPATDMQLKIGMTVNYNF